MKHSLFLLHTIIRVDKPHTKYGKVKFLKQTCIHVFIQIINILKV